MPRKKEYEKENEKNNENEENKHIHIILKDNRIEKFERIKAFYEHNSDVDAIRTCIDKTYDFLNQEPITIRPELKNILDLLISNPYLKSKYLVFTINDIINEALHQWVQSRRNELNLFSITFRSDLPPDEKAIALVFVEHQINFDNGLSFSDIKNILNDMDEKKILAILKKFQFYQLIRSHKINNQELYFAIYP